jgi:flagellar basal body rod protein FlgG
MMKCTAPTFALLALAACQSTAPTSPADDFWRAELEASQANLARSVKALHSLLAVQGRQPSGTSELNAGVVTLSDRLGQLGALIASSEASQATDAAFSGATTAGTASPGGEAAAGIEALKAALLVSENRRSVHLENIANAGVSGYKRGRLRVATTLVGTDGMQAPQTRSKSFEMLQGVLELTGNQLDFAIEGDGFFEIMLPDGQLRYRRDGTFRQDFNGRIVTAEGFLLTDPLAIPPDINGISVSNDGQVFAQGDGSQLAQIGTIRLHTFTNPGGLKPVGGNGFLPTASSGKAQSRQPGVQGTGMIKQGYIERSNVDLMDEVIELQLIEREAAAIRLALARRGIYVP